jgi:hypothetical protein
MLRRNDRREPFRVLPQVFVCSGKFGGVFLHTGFKFLSRFAQRDLPARMRPVRTGAADLAIFGL